MDPLYLDYNATSPLRPGVFEAMRPYLTDHFGNPSSLHHLGQRARKAIEDARKTMAQFIKARLPDEIIFTSGGTESINLALKGALFANPKKKRLVISAIEHSAVRAVARHLAETGRVELVEIPVNSDGILDLAKFKKALNSDTALASIMSANNEIGTLQPIEACAEACHDKGILFHSDAVQLAGKMPLDVQQSRIDMLSLAAHKFGGPKGVGLLYVREGTRLKSLVEGGHQEKNRRAGTENVPGIVGMAQAALHAAAHLPEESKRIKKARSLFEKSLLDAIPLTHRNGSKDERVPNTSNLCFEYTTNSETLMALDMAGVMCSSGSACQAGNPEPSHVLTALGAPQHRAHASLRFSLGPTITEEDIMIAVAAIKKVIGTLRTNHPLWKERRK